MLHCLSNDTSAGFIRGFNVSLIHGSLSGFISSEAEDGMIRNEPNFIEQIIDYSKLLTIQTITSQELFWKFFINVCLSLKSITQ
jgi:hypothetical protein